MGYPGRCLMQVKCRWFLFMHLFIFKLKTTSDDSWWFQECFGKCNPSFTLYTDHLPKPAQMWLASRSWSRSRNQKAFFIFNRNLYADWHMCDYELSRIQAAISWYQFLSISVWIERIPPSISPRCTAWAASYTEASVLPTALWHLFSVSKGADAANSRCVTRESLKLSCHHLSKLLFTLYSIIFILRVFFFSLGLAGTHKTHFKTSQK